MQNNIEPILMTLFFTCLLTYIIFWDIFFIMAKYDPIKFSPHYRYDFKAEMEHQYAIVEIIAWYKYMFFRALLLLVVMIDNPYFFEII